MKTAVAYKDYTIRLIDIPVLGIAGISKSIFGGAIRNYIIRPVIVQSWDGYRWIWRPRRQDEIGFARNHEPFMLDLLKRLLQERGVFLDVGANVGRYSIRLAQRASAVYSIEANPDNFSALTRNISLNRVTNITAFRRAAWNKKERLHISDDGGMSRVTEQGSYEVLGERIDDLIDKNPDVMKIDVEGAEFQVLQGTQRFTPGYIVCEIPRTTRTPNDSLTGQKITELINERGYMSLPMQKNGIPNNYLIFRLPSN